MMDNRKGTIYALIDPNTLLVRYIGQTICNVKKRYHQHIYAAKQEKSKVRHITSWIKYLANKYQTPILEIIEDNIEIEQLDSKEIQYIKLFKSIGANLCNHSEGGKGMRGFKQSIESRLKRAKSLETSELWKQKGPIHSKKMKEKYKKGEYYIGLNKLSPEEKQRACKKISENNVFRKHIILKNIITQELLEFTYVKEMITYFKVSPSTVNDFLNKKRKSSSKFKNYTIVLYENFNKYDK